MAKLHWNGAWWHAGRGEGFKGRGGRRGGVTVKLTLLIV
jgi:hypothetical protein